MNVLRIAGWSLLIGLGAAVVVQTRVMLANRRRIDQLEDRLTEVSTVNAVLRRAQQQDSDDKRRHLRLLALLPPALWVAATASRKPAIAGAVAASVFAAGTVSLDTQFAPHSELPRAEAGTTTVPPAPIVLRDRPTPTTTTPSTSTTVPAVAPPARLNEAPTTTTVPPTTTTTAAPPATTTTTLLPGTTLLEDDCLVGADKPLGLPVEAGVLCPGSG